MAKLRLASPAEVRDAIDRIPSGTIRVPAPITSDEARTVKVDGDTLRVTDMLCLVGGFRISEVCTLDYGSAGNTSSTLTMKPTRHQASGRMALLIHVNALKKRFPTVRDVGVPLDPRYEPYAEKILRAWDRAGGNPCAIDRHRCWLVNRVIFDGYGYQIRGRAEYLRGDNKKFLRDKSGKKILSKFVEPHLKPASDHFLRHTRATELRMLQLTAEERVSFFKWSSGYAGLNPMLGTYSEPEWFEYFPKLYPST